MAKRLILFMLKHYLFWLVLFAFGRTVFLFWNREELSGVPFGEISFAFVKGLYVDTAMAGYLLMIPFLCAIISSIRGWSLPLKINRGIHVILFFAFFMITFSELAIYDEWHTKLNYKALWFFQNPSEVFHTASTSQIIFPFLFTGVLTFACWRLHRKFVNEEFAGGGNKMLFILSALVVPCLLFIGVRGGFQTIPIQLSDAYYSQHNVLNLASVNSMFNLSSSVIENAKVKEPYAFLSSEDAIKEFNQVFPKESDGWDQILTTTRPNIVLIVLEGWSADMLESFNGIKGHNIAPNLDSIAMQGIRFTDCYASGSLSDQGMAAVFSAFPAQPLTSVITQPDKYTKLPCINKKLKAEGYHTSFMFGGQLSYGNIRSYMYFNEFDKITEQEDFGDEIPKGKLGAHDEFLFARQLQELKSEQQPFFAAMFTLSTHGPYDDPSSTDLHFGDKEADYVNSIHYADSCIGDFIHRAQKEPWYNNTLFVFVSDHSHNSPMNYSYISPEYRRIPLIFYGNVLDTVCRRQEMIGTISQTDLASTLLAQLGIDYSEFKYSRNYFNFSYDPFYTAYYSFEEGFGVVEPRSSLTWSVNGSADFTERTRTPFNKNITFADSLRLLKKGQAILQTLSTDYANY